MAGYFDLKRAAGDSFMFNLKAGNNEVILTSETYGLKQAAQSGIASVQSNSAKDERYDRKVASDGSPYFVLTALNGLTIGKSQMYSSASARDSGIDSCKANGKTTDVRDNT